MLYPASVPSSPAHSTNGTWIGEADSFARRYYEPTGRGLNLLEPAYARA
jgi:hypothetical protein